MIECTGRIASGQDTSSHVGCWVMVKLLRLAIWQWSEISQQQQHPRHKVRMTLLSRNTMLGLDTGTLVIEVAEQRLNGWEMNFWDYVGR